MCAFEKKLAGLIVSMAMVSLYFYQSPMMSTWEAVMSVEKHLQNPPEEWGNSIPPIDVKEIPIENINAVLSQQGGFWNQLTNRMQWEVTVKYSGIEPTVVMDAYNGKLINIYGPLH
jgi:hypothetical protein